MRSAVELGDGWSPFPNPPAASRATKTPAITNLDELAARLDARSVPTRRRSGGPRRSRSASRASPTTDDESVYADLGIDWLTVGFAGCRTRAEWLDRLGEFAARVR